MSPVISTATLKVPEPVSSVADDCKQLRKAFKGRGTNEELIISILAHRDAPQRKLIMQTYAETYGKDLHKALDKFSNDFERLVVLWTLDPAGRDAYLANQATKRTSSFFFFFSLFPYQKKKRRTSSYQVLMEIACTRSGPQLRLAKEAYNDRYKKSLEEDVAQRTTGDFHKLLVPLVRSCRSDGEEVNMTLAKAEAKILHMRISERAYSHEDVIRILATQSNAQLNATVNHYKKEFGNDIKKDLKANPKDKFLAILRATVKCLTRPENYFEKVLRLAIKGEGTDKGTLTRVVATRAEVDMTFISKEYQRRNNVRLDRAIAENTTGDYKKMLLALIGHTEA